MYEAEVGHELGKDTIVKILDVSDRCLMDLDLGLTDIPQVLAIVAKEQKLLLGRRLKATMYIEDVAEFTCMLLSTTEMTFQCGWLGSSYSSSAN